MTQNEGQIAAISHGAGPMLVLAGPGSGKTYVITHRIQRLISQCKVPPNHILVITFTKAAALEMQSRAILLDHQCSYVQFCTFHSIFYQILKLSKPGPNLSLASDRERLDFVKAVLRERNREVKTEKEIENRAQEYLKKISRIKNRLPRSVSDERKGKDGSLTEEERTADSQLSFIYQAYQEWLAENQKLDFDDMLSLCYCYLCENPSERRIWQERFRYILIDEFQDINPLQYETIKLLCKNHNLFAVGDDDQAIYGFRGSDPMLMKQFVREFSAKIVRLNVNYRCSGNIVKAASGFISHNRRRFSKQCVARKGAGEEVQIRDFPGRREETAFLREEIFKYQKENPDKTQAVLVRTNSFVSGYEGLFDKTVRKDEKVFEDLLAYLSFLHCGGKREDFLKIMNKPMRYISRSILTERIIDFSLLKRRLQEKPWIRKRLEKLEEQLIFASKLDLGGQLCYIWRAMGYEGYMVENAAGDREKIRESTEAFEELLDRAKRCDSLDELRKSVADREENKRKEPGSNVRIMTYHGAKGLEFDRVYLPELNYKIVPHGRMLSPEELEEERRMFYVALTRAKESLMLLYAKEQTASPFLAELTL